MGAAGAGGSSPSGQVMLQGYYDDSPSGYTQMSWTVPEGVTSICAVAIGAGEVGERSNTDADGGKGGDLRYVNDIPVTPGETLTLGAGKGFMGDATELDYGHSGSGYASYLKRSSTSLVYAQGGNDIGTNVGTGGDGGPAMDGSSLSSNKGGGGGDAGGYDSNGSTASSSNWLGQCGDGRGLTGDDETTQEGGAPTGYHGRAGANWRGAYGGGGGGMDSGATSARASNGAPGAVRVIWGEDRSYPSNAKGVFPTAPAGTELDIRFHPPVNYANDTPYWSKRNEMTHIRIFDDTGTNIVAASDWNQGGTYNGLNYYNSQADTDTAGDLDDASLTTDFDDITAPGFGYNHAMGTGVINRAYIERMFDTDLDVHNEMPMINWGSDSVFGDASNRTDTDEYLTGANHNDNSFTNQWLFKFDSPKVIKKIHFYGHQYSWIPRCRIFLDGNLIADDAAHYVQPDTDEGHSSVHTSGSRRLAVFEFT